MTEQSDTLRSTSYARVVDLIGEGVIYGLATGDEKSIYLDETPLMNPDGTRNFQGVAWTIAVGAGYTFQPAFQGFTDTESLVTVGVEVKADTPITRQITNPGVDAAAVTITVPALSRTVQTTGDVEGTSVVLRIEVQPSGGAWTIAETVTISGKTSSQYQRQVRVPLAGAAPWNLRVVRVTPDSTSQFLQNKTFWSSFTEIVDEKLNYPLSALIALSVDAEQVGNIPSRAYRVKGLKIRVPVNYNPLTRAYTGSWNGTFASDLQWTDNPAWCLYDLLTHPRYGLGRYIGMSVDKWAMYQIGRYCDELVPDGFGGMEPRFRCNLYLGNRAEAFRVVQDLASIFNGMVYWAAGGVTAVQDAPSSPVALYTPANVIDGEFTYSGSSGKARHTAALVTWNDPADMCRQKVEYVEDREGIQRYGLITTTLAAIGCTSRGQAHRVGKWLLYSERMQTETVTFKAGLDTLYCRPGQIIKVADPARAGVRLGGRLRAATAASVTLDAPVTLQAGQTYTLSCLRADMSVMETTVTTGAGTTSTLALSPALPEAPAVGSIWVLTSASVDAQLFRVISVTEYEPGQFEVTALAHEPSKYGAIEQGLKLQTRTISVLKAKPDAPTNLAVSEALYARGAVLATRLDVSWTAPEGANAFAVSWRRSDGVASGERIVYEAGIEIDAAQEGQTYDVTVYAINPLGARSRLPAAATHLVLGKAASPSDVAGFVVARTGDQLAFTWRPVFDLDADRYEIRLGEYWDTAVVVGSAPHPTNALSIISPRGGTYLVKAVDTSGNYSAAAAAVVAPNLLGINVIVSHDDGAVSFPGTRTDLVYYTIDSKSGLTLASGALTGVYTTQPIDLGVNALSLIALDAVVDTLGAMYLPWSTYTQPWTSYTVPWQATGGGITAGYEVRTSVDGSTWTAWSTFLPGAYQCRYLQIRTTIGTSEPLFKPFLTRLVVNVDVPDRVLHLADVAVPAAGQTLTFTPPFVDVSTVQITLQSAAPGDNATVTAKSSSAVTVQIYDAAGSPRAGVLDIDVFGYGERY